ncbi:hypothetical protein HW49_06055, partial [Porphyromonadaceae bacterium COT-184 OH4590]
KWIAFSLILWGIISIIGFINVVFFFEEFRMSYECEKWALDITEALFVTWLEPIHHILFIVAVVWIIVKWYKNRMNNRIGN